MAKLTRRHLRPRSRRGSRADPADEMLLSPQSEAPRHPHGQDRSRRAAKVEELTWPEFDRLINRLAREISQSFNVEAVVGVVHGGVFVGGALARALASDFFPVRISRRSRDRGRLARPKLSGRMPRELKGRRVLIVDDVVSSGDTLELAKEHARKAGAKEVRTAGLVAREDGYTPDFAGRVTDRLWVFPWDYEPVVEDRRFDVDPDTAGA